MIDSRLTDSNPRHDALDQHRKRLRLHKSGNARLIAYRHARQVRLAQKRLGMVEPIVRIAHLVREIKFCDRQIAGQRDVGVAARPYRAGVDWVTATCPSPVCGCSRPGSWRLRLDVQGCAGIVWRPTCGANPDSCWKMLGPWKGMERRTSMQQRADRSPSAVGVA